MDDNADKEKQSEQDIPTPTTHQHLPPSFYHPHSRPVTQPSKAQLRFLAVAMLVILSGSAGFAGGWLGSRHIDDSNQNIQKQQVVLKTQGDLISTIAKNVGTSVVSVETTATTQPTSSFFGF